MSLFLPFYIDRDEQENYNVIRLEPAMVDYMTAYFTLNTYKYDDYHSFIIQAADSKSLDHFGTEMQQLKSNDSNSLIEDIHALIQKNKPQIMLMWEKELNAVTAVAGMLLPTETNKPVGMNPRNKGLWTYIIRNYRQHIRKYKAPQKQWAVAVLLYKRACYLNNLRPFIYVPIAKKPQEEIKKKHDAIVAKVKDGYGKAGMLVESIYANLFDLGYVTIRSNTWEYKGLLKTTLFTGTLNKEMALTKNKKIKDVISYLVEFEAFRKTSHSSAELTIDSITSIVYTQHPKNKKAVLTTIKFAFDKRTAALLFGVEENTAPVKFMAELDQWMQDVFVVK